MVELIDGRIMHGLIMFQKPGSIHCTEIGCNWPNSWPELSVEVVRDQLQNGFPFYGVYFLLNVTFEVVLKPLYYYELSMLNIA